MQFNGSSNDEQFDVSANGPRVRFLRNVGNITMDLDDVEQINTAALGGGDTFTAHNLTGTDATELDTDLAGTPGGTAGDGQNDRVIVEGTAGNDALKRPARPVRCRWSGRGRSSGSRTPTRPTTSSSARSRATTP